MILFFNNMDSDSTDKKKNIFFSYDSHHDIYTFSYW